MHSHDIYMRIALKEAWKAYEMDEVPVGAIIVNYDGQILAKARNEIITRNDPTAHAEILALRQAAEVLGNYRLLNTRLYVTIEPCLMCAGALIHARVEGVVFGAYDERWGALQSLYQIGHDERLNHRLSVVSGVLEAECADIIQRFFRERRAPEEEPSSEPPVYILDDDPLES